MRSIRLLIAFTLLSLCAFAQHSSERVALNQKIVAAVSAEKFDEALALLGELEALKPEDSGTAYNYACVFAHKGEADPAFEWLDKAVRRGWGGGKGAIAVADVQSAQMVWHSEMLEQDKDLDSLRKDARFAKILERAKALQKRVVEYSAAPAVYVPEKLKSAPEIALLVVLHAQGGDKQSTLDAWKGVADELGCALAVPAAPVLLREDAHAGWGWIDEMDVFAIAGRTAEYQRPVLAALDVVRKQRSLSPSRVWIAGEGEGATLALVSALHNSLLLRGVAVLDPDVVPALCGYKVPVAKANGLRLETRFDPQYWKARPGVLAPKESVSAWALAGSTSEVADLKDAAGRHAALVEAVRALVKAADAAVQAAPAVAPK